MCDFLSPQEKSCQREQRAEGQMAKVGDEGGGSIYFETDQGNSETSLESSTGDSPRPGEH